MPAVTLTDVFLASMRRLDASDARRAAQFVDKLLHAPEASGFRPEILHDAHDRSIRSFHVTHDLRAVAHLDGEQVTLLYVARHDRAYEWAKTRCIVCLSDGSGMRLVQDAPAAEEPVSELACASSRDLRLLLEEHALAHALD